MSPIVTSFILIIVVLFIILINEFVIDSIIKSRLMSVFPQQKHKTIRKKQKRISFLRRISLLYLLEYDNSTKSKTCIGICYVSRIVVLIICVGIILRTSLFVETDMWLCLELFWVISALMYLKKTKDK